jgi:hypothetical protein
MLVPKFWAEGRVQERTAKKQVTVRRFGWSDESQANAQAMADARAHEALARLLRGERLPRRELKRAYNGSEGVPIREEIVASYDETVLTRNSYGAVCLNTPNVLFADVDFSDSPSGRLIRSVVIELIAVAIGVGFWQHSWRVGFVGVLVALLACYPIASGVHRLFVSMSGGPEEQAKDRIRGFLREHADWNVRLYRTPAGLRMMATHATLDPNEAVVAECFRVLGVDPIYARMCMRQQCFRARVSPKPWRIGIGQHMRPQPGIWPIDPGRLPERRRWIEEYERAALNYASCRFMEALGSGVVSAAVADVVRIHDELCQAESDLPIA